MNSDFGEIVFSLTTADDGLFNPSASISRDHVATNQNGRGSRDSEQGMSANPNGQRLAGRPRGNQPGRPCWNAEDRELWYDQRLVLVFERSAPHLELIVAVFEEEGWRRTIDDPLPGTSRHRAHQRLRDAVRHLNEKQSIPVLGFHVVRNGTAIQWEQARAPK